MYNEIVLQFTNKSNGRFLRVLKNLVKTFIENDELKQFTCFGAI